MKEENIDSNYIIQYLLNSMQQQNVDTKEKQANLDIKNPMFLYEFFVFDLYIPKEIVRSINTPVLAFRLLDFPTQSIEGFKNVEKSCISFNQGKSCFFEMEMNRLKNYLLEEPLYIMLMDTNNGNMRVLGSSRVNISIFVYDQFLDYEGDPPLPRRNLLKLFDNNGHTVGEFDVTLLIKRETFKYQDKSAEPNLIPKNIREKCVDMDAPVTTKNNANVDKIFNMLKNEEDYIDFMKSQQSKKPSNKENEFKAKENANKKGTKFEYENEDYVPEKKANTQKIIKVNKIESEMDQINLKAIQTFLDPSNIETYIGNLKSLLEGKDKLPPPMFFHKEKNIDLDARKVYKQKPKKEQGKDDEEKVEVVLEENEEDYSKKEKDKENSNNSKKDISIDKSVTNNEKSNSSKISKKTKEKEKFVTKPKELKKEIKLADPVEEKKTFSKMKHIFSKNTTTTTTNPNERYYENKMKEINRYTEMQKPIIEKTEHSNYALEDENEYINIYNRMKPVERKKIYDGKKPTTNNKKVEENKIDDAKKNPMALSKESNYENDQFLSVTHSQFFSINTSNNNKESKDIVEKVIEKENQQQEVQKTGSTKIVNVKQSISSKGEKEEESIKSSIDNSNFNQYLKSSKDQDSSSNFQNKTPIPMNANNQSVKEEVNKDNKNSNNNRVINDKSVKISRNKTIESNDTISDDYEFDKYDDDIVEEDIPYNSISPTNKKHKKKSLGNSTLNGKKLINIT